MPNFALTPDKYNLIPTGEEGGADLISVYDIARGQMYAVSLTRALALGGGGGSVAWQEEGSTIVSGATANFVGASVTVTDVGGVATITITDNVTTDAGDLTSGTLPDGRFPATLPAVSGANLTALNANNLAAGTLPDARFPATLPAASGVNLTALNASNLGSGTVPDARFPATLPAASGVNLTALNASNLASGTVGTARLGTGTADATTFLRGDGSWQVPAGGGTEGNITLNNQTGTTYTLVITDLGKMVRMNNAAANTLTVPPNSSVAFSIGDTVLIEQQGAGATTIAPGAGVTLNTPPHTTLTLAGQRSIVTIIKVGTDEWEVSGALTSTEPVEQTVAIATADVPIDYSAGRVVKTTMNANISTFTVTNPPASGTFGSILWKGIADGTGRTVAFLVNGVTAKWDGGSPPTIPSTSGNEIWVQLVSSDGYTSAVTALLVAAEIS